ncbi:MAG: hypothetical protein J6Y32_03345 [Bacteroidales bacterium]|nr:hypothetical protein [Bacteroidales bacterium]
MIKRLMLAALLGAAFVFSCSRAVPELVFLKGDDGVWRVSEENMDCWAKALSKADTANARQMIDRAYYIADSLSTGEEGYHTLEAFAHALADRFLVIDSPLYNENLYDMVLDREWECENWPSWGRRSTQWRRALLNLNRAGTMVSDFWLSSEDAAVQDTLLRQLLQAAPQTVLFIYGASCPACDKLIKQISRSGDFRKMAASADWQFVSLYTGEDKAEFATKAASLPSYWQNWCDRENVVMYDRAFDGRMIPSLYVIGADGIVQLRGARTVKKLVAFVKKGDKNDRK